MALLEVRDVEIGFGDEVLLQQVNLQIQENEAISIQKGVLDGGSSLLKSFAGAVLPSQGSIMLDGQEVHTLESKTRFASVCYCYEHGGLVSTFTNYNNIAFPMVYHGLCSEREIRERITHLAQQLDIAHLLNKEPFQLNDVQARLFNLLRGLCVRPRLLLVDELQGGMSVDFRDRVLDLLHTEQHHQGFALVMTVTAGDSIDLCSRHLTIQQGALLTL